VVACHFVASSPRRWCFSTSRSFAFSCYMKTEKKAPRRGKVCYCPSWYKYLRVGNCISRAAHWPPSILVLLLLFSAPTLRYTPLIHPHLELSIQYCEEIELISTTVANGVCSLKLLSFSKMQSNDFLEAFSLLQDDLHCKVQS